MTCLDLSPISHDTDWLQNSRSLRRLAGDHAALHHQPLPPNYLFPSDGSDDTDNLTQLDVLIAGPTHTPFAAGVWKLHLNIPPEYPQQPPTAHFRTPIFHPNVEPQTGSVCVETLKRDWDAKLTLRDVLVTISCLLIQPNPDSALNAEAGSLIQESYEAFVRRAELMTSIHALIPRALRDAVKEAQVRGQEAVQGHATSDGAVGVPTAPARRRRPTARQRATTATRRKDGSPSGAQVKRRHQPEQEPHPFVIQSRPDDVFDSDATSRREDASLSLDDDSSILMDADQENDETRSPKKPQVPKMHGTPKRPPGAPVPLGELTLEEPSLSEVEDSMEMEYPPSPRKSSPLKSPAKRKPQLNPEVLAESSRDAAARNITPTNNPFAQPLAHDSPYTWDDTSVSPRKQTRMLQETPKRAPLFPGLSTPREPRSGIFNTRSPTSAEKKAQKMRRRAQLESELWVMCEGDIEKWNRGDFNGEPFAKKARRW